MLDKSPLLALERVPFPGALLYTRWVTLDKLKIKSYYTEKSAICTILGTLSCKKILTPKPQYIHIKTLHFRIYPRGEVSVGNLGLEGKALMKGIVFFMRRDIRGILPSSSIYAYGKKAAIWQPRRGFSPEADPSYTPILDFPASRTVKNKFVLLKPHGLSHLVHFIYFTNSSWPIQLAISRLRAYSETSLPEFLSWFYCLLALFVVCLIFGLLVLIARVLLNLAYEKFGSISQCDFLQRFVISFKQGQGKFLDPILGPFLVLWLSSENNPHCLLVV